MAVIHYLRHRRWMEVMFSSLFVCLSVCLCEQDISKRYGGIWSKLGWHVRYVQGQIDLILVKTGPGSRHENFSNDSSPLRPGVKNDVLHDISKSGGWIMTTLGG